MTEWPAVVAGTGFLVGGLAVAQRLWDLWRQFRAHTAAQVREEVRVEQLAAEVASLRLSQQGQARELAELRVALEEVSHVQHPELARIRAGLDRIEEQLHRR